ncbi:MAG: DUF4125 family protein [Lachnospiraceae bacterium]|nr:DUF4125 family protein [Lachnospiraceae bacterium]
MDIHSILADYDAMFGKVSLDQIEAYLYEKITEAVSIGDDSAILTLLNEMIGLCRDTSQKDKALVYAGQLKNLLDRMELEGTESYATSMQNIANAYRAFGLWEEAENAFQLIQKTYEVYLDKENILWASLYNNWGLLYQEMGYYEKSVDVLQKALAQISRIQDAQIKQATTMGNLANSYVQLGDMGKAYDCLQKALYIFREDGERDFHYGATLAAMGDYLVLEREYDTAKDYYRKALVEILIHTGKTEFYQRVLEKYEMAEGKMQEKEENRSWVSNLQRSKQFYEQFGAKMIERLFPEYKERIAIGMVGEGSDCFGFDDEISADHDYEVGFCMWLTTGDYKEIGLDLQKAYEELVAEHIKGGRNSHLFRRRGVFEIDSFYQENSLHQGYTEIEEWKLAELVNGEVFRDDLGVFSEKREQLLKYYPEEIWRKKLASLLHDFAQYGQSNYGRMMAREDYVTASLCIAKTMESAMDIAYVLLRKYAPYYKWKKKGLEKKDDFARPVLWVCEELAQLSCQKQAWTGVKYDPSKPNSDDKAVALIELLAKLLLQEMMAQDLVRGKDTFLEVYMTQILETKKELVDQIVKLEWQQFDQVKNEGGRADCQDNFPTFSIMRKSQYLTWEEVLLQSYLTDLKTAQREGWNLITEKYARMMKSTAPEKYAELEKELPVRSKERQAIAEEIIKIQVAWMEDFASKYPKMAGNARSIHTYEDNAFNTSYETYLRGELGTYSEETFVLYGRFITSLLQKGVNLAYEIMNQTAKLYGYKSVEDAEAKL